MAQNYCFCFQCLIGIVFISNILVVSSEILRNDSQEPICDDQYPSETCDIKFKSNIISNEYIVTFHHYYKSRTRNNYLQAALKLANITNWQIVARANAAFIYPSDFDVLKINKNANLNDFALNHPAIKSVTSHRLVQRTLNYKILDRSGSDEILYKDIPLNISGLSKYNILNTNIKTGRQLLRAVPRQITTILHANVLWEMGITGKGIKVAVFDTGLSKGHPHFRKIKERTNWTNEKSLEDGVSHGTFVAGVIASAVECLGFAPDAELHIFRVFTNTQVSYTSWFLDAFNYAIMKKINVLNLSIGGPDFLDSPFVEKVLELSANKVIMISAIGNDGPLYGTLNNPGDQSDVIGVGGINFEESVAKFSSRGMTTWELPRGYGRLKPDIVTYGSQVKGSNIKGGCRSLSGTSVASPVVAGAVTLIASGVLNNLEIINPSSMKQVLMEGANRLSANNMFEQGHGKLNILRSMELLATYKPKITLSPAYLDFAESYMWPYSSQPIFCGSAPVIVNVTILNGISVTGFILEEPKWHPNLQNFGDFLNISFSFSPILWPWSGWMSVYVVVNDKGCNYEGFANGYIKLIVQTQATSDENAKPVYFPLNVRIIPKPPRHKRILWDQFHSLRYPPGYLPRDNLKIKSDPLDWKADHIHTNFRDMYNHLRDSGYYVDILRESFGCFDASQYGTLLIVDPEEEYFDEEIVKLHKDVYENGLNVIVFADWYNTTVMKKIKFFDENTRQWWIPDTGGANIPAINELLQTFGIAFGDLVAEGYYTMGDHNMYYASGSVIAQFPNTTDSILIGANLRDQGLEIIKNIESDPKIKHFVPILGLLHVSQIKRTHYVQDNSIVAQSSYEQNAMDQPDIKAIQSIEHNPILNKRILLETNEDILKSAEGFSKKIGDKKEPMALNTNTNHRNQKTKEGRIAVFGDSNCLDSTHLDKPCYWLLDALLEFTMSSYVSSLLKNINKKSNFQYMDKKPLPMRLLTSNLHMYSKVLKSTNMFEKRSIDKCEKLQWAPENEISELENIIDDNRIQHMFKNTNADSLLQDTSENDIKSVDEPIMYENKGVLETGLYGDTKNVKIHESLHYSIVLIVILTIVVLYLCINRLKRYANKIFWKPLY